MSDRIAIGLDDPAFRGRLRQPSGLARSPHSSVLPQNLRPSVRYFNDFSVRPRIKHYSPQMPVTLKPEAPKPAPVLHRQLQASQVLKRPPLYTFSVPPQKSKNRWQALVSNIRIQQYSREQLTLMAMGLTIFLLGTSVSLSILKTNHLATAQVDALSKTAAAQSATTDDAAQSSKITANNSSVPSTAKPSSATISNYAVAPNQPRFVDIPRFGVHARVLSLGILNNGALATPNNVYDAGWYNSSSLPGQPGAMLLDGHVSSWTTHGVFYDLSKLVAGDQIKVTRGDGQVFTYVVVKSRTFDRDTVDMQSAIQPIDPSAPGLNLITCAGQVVKGTNEFSKRILVYTKQL